MDGDLDLDAATGLASLVSDKGKPRASRKTAAPKPKKVLTAEQRAKESTKRKDRRHAAGARDEAIAAATAQQQITNARVAAATREVLCMLGLTLASTASSTPPRPPRSAPAHPPSLVRCCPTRPAHRLATRCPASTSTHRPPASWGSARPR
ncbi:hypothetical protein D1007_50181 [Hordeum vulgare]|nr:hypothetical protein D1007_50181 [Hordeum vulgare]